MVKCTRFWLWAGNSPFPFLYYDITVHWWTLTNEGDNNHRDNIDINYKDSYVEPGKLWRMPHILHPLLPVPSVFLFSSCFSSLSLPGAEPLDFLPGNWYLECLALPGDPVAGNVQATLAWLGEGSVVVSSGQGGRERLGREKGGEEQDGVIGQSSHEFVR